MTQSLAPRRTGAPVAAFAFATLGPHLMLTCAALWGGALLPAAVLAIGILPVLLDRVMHAAAADPGPETEFPAADLLLVALAVCHLAGLGLAVWAIAGDSGHSLVARGLLFLGFGQVFAQISNPVAHELIHRGDRRLFRLGMAVYVSLLHGHHVSAHRLVHHPHVATMADPNSAPRGEGFYRFLLRAWPQSFLAGLAAENTRRGRARALPGRRGPHPYALYLAGTLLCGLGALGLAGWAGLAVWAGLGLFATSGLYLSDYVQHYGLRRRMIDGRIEPVGPQHSWNAPQPASAALMLNAPRHSDHHAHPARPYPALRLQDRDSMPWLPHSLPVCSVIALCPPWWRRMMRPHLAAWENPDHATAHGAGRQGMPPCGPDDRRR